MTYRAIFVFLTLCVNQIGLCQQSEELSISNQLNERFESLVVFENEGIALPHRVVCEPIKLTEKISSESHLEQLLLRFLDDNDDLLGVDINTIKKRSIHKAGKNWYADFYQVHNSKEVLDSEVTFRVNENGNLFMFGLDYYKNIRIPSRMKLSKSSILESLKSIYTSIEEVSYDFGGMYILPSWENGKRIFKDVQLVDINDKNQLSEIVFVNQNDGTIEKSIHKCLHCTIQGSCSAHILPTVATDNQEVNKMPFLNILIDGNQIAGNKDGNFNFEIDSLSANLVAGLNGKFVSLQNFSGAEAKIEIEVKCDQGFSLVWDDSNSTLSERNVYYHITKLHQYNKQVDDDFVGLDYPLECIVNDNSAFCNAYWNGNNLHFNTQDATCAMNSAHGASVIYHEYGHAINDRLYNQIGQPWGMKNPVLQEAFSDIYSTLFLEDSRFALGWFGPGTMTRNLNNFNRYPGSVVGQQHTDGLILGGAFWDLGELTSPETAYDLAHFAKYGAPDDEDLAVAFAEVYLETLVADDDDGNLLNGSPNSEAIQEAFCNHGIGSNLLVSQKLIHSEYPNTLNSTDDYRITVEVPQLSLFENYDHLTLVYSVDNFDNQEEIVMEVGDDFEYRADIPAMDEGTLVKYYIEVQDNECGGTYYYPSLEYRSEYLSFMVGLFEEIFKDDFEEDQGWLLFNASDNATAGQWQRSKPQEVINAIGQLVSPGSDFSDDGEKCMVTGANFGPIWYANDVDGGKTTVTSPVFSNLNEYSIFEFHKWFTHGSGFIFPAQGLWKLQVSNNGSNWVTVEQTNYGDHRYWIKGRYRFSDFVNITNQIQVRFEVSDFGQGSIVEGLVDDFKIYNLGGATNTLDKAFSNWFDVYPNPSSHILNIELNEKLKNNVTFSIYSVDGIKIETNVLKNENGLIQFDVSDIKSGVYILSGSSERQKFNQMITII